MTLVLITALFTVCMGRLQKKNVYITDGPLIKKYQKWREQIEKFRGYLSMESFAGVSNNFLIFQNLNFLKAQTVNNSHSLMPAASILATLLFCFFPFLAFFKL